MHKRTHYRDLAAIQVAYNWRIRRRLPNITAYAVYYGFITTDITPYE
jgi:hypothetical protein